MSASEKNKPHVLFSRVFPTLGVVGLVITVALNLAALLFFKKPAAEFFSPGWWTTWSPSYLIWLTFLLLGLAGWAMKPRAAAS